MDLDWLPVPGRLRHLLQRLFHFDARIIIYQTRNATFHCDSGMDELICKLVLLLVNTSTVLTCWPQMICASCCLMRIHQVGVR